MNDERKRLIWFFLLSFVMLWGGYKLLDITGLGPPKPDPALTEKLAQGEGAASGLALEKDGKIAAKADAEPKADTKASPKADGKSAGEVTGKPAEKSPAPRVEVVKTPLILGNAEDHEDQGYYLQLELSQRGAGVARIYSSRFHAERDFRDPALEPLALVKPMAGIPMAFTLNLVAPPGVFLEDHDKILESLADRNWEVVPNEQGQLVRNLPPNGNGENVNPRPIQEVVFRTQVGSPPLTVTKTYQLAPAQNTFQMNITFSSPQDRTLAYELMGPTGVPIEGEWYTTTFRDFLFAGDDRGSIDLQPRTAYNVSWYYGKGRDYEERFQTLPLAYTGVENRYFAVLLSPNHQATPEGRYDYETVPLELSRRETNRNLSDIGVEILSRPINVGPNRTVTQEYTIFAGPKKSAVLAATGIVGLEKLATYHLGWSFPLTNELAKYVITPLLIKIHDMTAVVAGWFGGTSGSYGIAIFLLTCVIRTCLFPLGRKQAVMAKKMQDLQPLLVEIQNKYKKNGNAQEMSREDQTEMLRETFALYKRYNVKPFSSGCLIALIQLPIFLGLLQALNNSVDLRESPFLYIQNLAAPDMMFSWGVDLPLLGRYFNLLPIVSGVLMYFQFKLFTPPATTPEQEMQHRMFKIMMIISPLIFYKFPSGLGVYFITSSAWSIGERLLVNRLAKKHTLDLTPAATATPAKPAKPGLLQRLLEQADTNATIRNKAATDANTRAVNGAKGGGAKSGGDASGSGNGPGKARPKGGNRRGS